MPKEVRRRSSDLRQIAAKIIERDGFVDSTSYAVAIKSGGATAATALRRLEQQGRLKRVMVPGVNTAGRKYFKPTWVLAGASGPLDKLVEEGEAAREAQRRKQREYQREYYRRKQDEKKGVQTGRRYGQPGRPKSGRSALLESSHRLSEAAAILFPNGLRTDEAFFAWVDLTRELMNG